MDITQIINQLVAQTQQSAKIIEDKFTTDSLQSPDAMLDIQFSLFKYNNILNCTSAIIKNFKDLISSVVSKI